jgi:hypothetical protein
LTINIHNISLLTGAGFTYNFGTPLASGVWAEIFNQPDLLNNQELRDRMLANFDFEAVYQEVISSADLGDDTKDLMTSCVREAYNSMDDIVRNFESTKQTKWRSVNKFVELFKKPLHASFLFTLNQDLFLERHISFKHDNFSIPGLENETGTDHYKNFIVQKNRRLSAEDYIKLPNNVPNTIFDDEKLYYVKLHGSQNWIHSSASSSHMVIGKGKQQQILQEPLLNNYSNKFEEVLKLPNMKLVVVGYSFSDSHINQALYNGVCHHNLELIVINPSSISSFKDSFYNNINSSFGPNTHLCNPDILWSKGLRGYFQNTFEEIFPYYQENETPAAIKLKALLER